jgi:hypothetical protein
MFAQMKGNAGIKELAFIKQNIIRTSITVKLYFIHYKQKIFVMNRKHMS